jgi:cysteine synthase B
MHGLEGWKHLETARVPAIFNNKIADSWLEVNTADAYQFMLEAKEKEGLSLSPSAAANLKAAIQIASQIESGTVVTILPDNGDRYQDIIDKLKQK